MYFFELLMPNASAEPRARAAATEERRLLRIGSSDLFGGVGRCSGRLSLVSSVWASPVSLGTTSA
jgi:hypothetical protein